MRKHFAPLLCLTALLAGPLAARQILLTSSSRVVGRTLVIEGTTDLPDSAVIEWELRHESLFKRRDIPIAFWDERLSTAAVQRMLTDEADLSRKRRAEVVDKAAAAYILQGALDSLRSAP